MPDRNVTAASRITNLVIAIGALVTAVGGIVGAWRGHITATCAGGIAKIAESEAGAANTLATDGAFSRGASADHC